MLRFGAFKVSDMLFFHKQSIVAVEMMFCHPKKRQTLGAMIRHVAKACIDRFTCADFYKTKLNSAR
jgi:hypothetical protein